jgi:hypothetical protein
LEFVLAYISCTTPPFSIVNSAYFPLVGSDPESTTLPVTCRVLPVVDVELRFAVAVMDGSTGASGSGIVTVITENGLSKIYGGPSSTERIS